MSNVRDVRVDEATLKMQAFLSAYGPDNTQLLLWVIRQLGHGRPLTLKQVDQHIAELGIAPDAAHQFLRAVTESDETNQIIGAMGLSLGEHPHRLSVGEVSLSAWCALDTLYLPAMLQQTVTITSPSPVTHQPIQLRVSPTRVEEINPSDAVVSLILVDPSQENMATVQAIWGTFCDHIYFFATRDEAEQWAKGRDDQNNIAILTVEEGFARAGQIWSRVFPDLYGA